MGVIIELLTHKREVCGREDLRELERDMGEHVVVLRPLRVRRVHVEARAWRRIQSRQCAGCGRLVALGRTDAKVPAVRLALDARAARGGVREKDRDALLGGGAQEVALLGAVVRVGRG